MSNASISPAVLAASIIAGGLPASAAIGRPDAFPFLSRNAFLGTSSKIDAGQSVGILSAVLYMMPARESGREACPGRSAGCSAACLAEGTGRMSMSPARAARRRRHAAFFADRGAFLAQLDREITAHVKRAAKHGKRPAIRLNGTTDLPWHRMPFTRETGERFANLHAAHPEVAFYEYTKMPLRVMSRGGIPANLSLTFSLSDRADSDAHAWDYLRAGHGAAVVLGIARHDVPATYPIAVPGRGRVLDTGNRTPIRVPFPTVDGDAHDARFLDPAGSVVVLAAKGRAKSDTSGFVRSVA